jgi:hypothetical protein
MTPNLINHRVLRNALRGNDAYRAVSDAIRAEVNRLAPKEPSAEQIADLLCGTSNSLDLYTALNAPRREVLRTALWTRIANFIVGIGDPTTDEILALAAPLRDDADIVTFMNEAFGVSTAINEEAF